MKYELYSVKDVLTGSMNGIQTFVNKDVAVRWFKGLVEESKIAKDLQLFCLGTYDIQTGIIESNVDFICSAIE